MANEFVLTKRGKLELEKQLDYLKDVRRAEISEQIKEARSFGDLSENAEYAEARNEQSRVEGRIRELESTLTRATVVEDGEVNLGRVSVGTKVRIADKESSEEETYQILGSMETSATSHILSNESPVGKALLGHGVGDVVEVRAPGGKMRFTILEITKAD